MNLLPPMTKSDTQIIRHDLHQFKTLFLSAFPDTPSNLYYDVISECKMANMHYFSDSFPDKFIPFDNDSLSTIRIEFGVKLEEMGYKGAFNKDVVADGISYFCNQNRVNPWRNWLESLTWDGVPRVRTWFSKVIGARTSCLSRNDDLIYIGNVTIAWAMGSIARQYGTAQADVIPLLIGEQRIGKSNCLRFMAYDERWFSDTTSDMTNPKSFLESIRGSTIVELSEATAIRSKESERTKSFISKREDKERRAYDREVTYTSRKWVLVATSNLKTPFTDITGNMRYFPIYCHDWPENNIKRFFDDEEFAKHEVEQFWAEAMDMYRSGATPNLDEFTKGIAYKVQQFASKRNPVIEYLNEFLDTDERYNHRGAFITRKEIENIIVNSDSWSIRGQATSPNSNFIFQWLNTTGCDWVEYRRRDKDALGTITRTRGFIRENDARIPDDNDFDFS